MNKIFVFVLFVALAFASCTADQRRSLEARPKALGKTNEIVIVSDQDIWDGPVGDTLRYYFSAPFLILPQPEPVFDLRHFTMEELNQEPLRKQLRTYVVLGDLGDDRSITGKEIRTDLRSENVRRAIENPSFNSTAGRNKWAQGQMLIYIFGVGEQALINNIRKNYPIISRKVRDFDRSQIDASTYIMGRNNSATSIIKEKMGFDLGVPSDYYLAIEDHPFMWLRRETKDASSNIMLYKVPYTDKAQLTKEGIKKIRNELGKKYITTDIEGAYMRINDEDLPMFVENEKLGGCFALEARGIWDIENDFMGGAFMSYLVLNEQTNELIFIDGFIHAPGKGKRDYMQYLEHVFKSFKLNVVAENN